MIKSKAWNWKLANEDVKNFWRNPSIESYYLLNRWLRQGKEVFLDLGCGMGRHTILFGKAGFKTKAFDLSEKAIEETKKWAEEEKLIVDYKLGDMLNLPYEDASIDCILCRNVVSHTDTEGMRKVIEELKRVLKKGGECYLTLGSKETWGFKQDFPVVDENTKIRVEDGPEDGIPHFYADARLIFELFKDFEIVNLEHIEDRIAIVNDDYSSSWHYHLLIRKQL